MKINYLLISQSNLYTKYEVNSIRDERDNNKTNRHREIIDIFYSSKSQRLCIWFEIRQEKWASPWKTVSSSK